MIIASKFGISHGGDFTLILDSSPKKIYESIEGSLKRLQVKCIDLYYQHRIDPKVEPETVANVMKDLISKGKIKAWGISETDENYLRKAHAVCPVSAVQNCYSMVVRKHEKLIKVCKELGITFVAYSPIANGFLSGMFNENSKFAKDDVRSIMPQYSEAGFKKAKILFSFLNNLAKEKNSTLAQISLAWMINKHSNLVPIPGSTKIKNIEANSKSKDVILSKEEINRIDKLLDESNIPFFGGFSGK